MPPRKPKPEPEASQAYKAKRKTMPIQVETELAEIASTVAAHDGITVGALVNDYLRPFLIEHYRRVQREISERVRRLDAAGE